MVLAGDVITTANSDENTFIETNNLVNLQILSPPNLLPASLQKTGVAAKYSTVCNNAKSTTNPFVHIVSRPIAMQNCSTNSESPSSNSEESISITSDSTASSRGLKMKIKRKTGATKAEDKHEIVNSCDDLRDRKCKVKRDRNRGISGNSSSECDPYDFGAKTDDEELPVKKLKLEKIDECQSTKEVGINAYTMGTMTEPDLLGPCEPGSSICLNGIVWLETDNGMLVINVTWRGRTYIGTLLDATKHDFAPPLPQNYISPIESRNITRGRGKRRGASMAQYYRNVRGKGRGGCRVLTPSLPNTPTDSDDESKRSRSRRNSPADSSASGTIFAGGASGSNDEQSFPIPCVQPNCCKRFADVTALRFHMNQSHAKKHTRPAALHNHPKSNPARHKEGEMGPRRRSPTKRKEPHPSPTKEKLNNHINNNGDAASGDQHSRIPSDNVIADDTVFKTPSSAATLQKPQPSGQVNCVSSLNSSTPEISQSSVSTAPVINIKSVIPSASSQQSQPPHPLGVRTVTAHTVSVPVDRAPASNSPSRTTSSSKKSDDHRKNNNVKRSLAPTPLLSTATVSSHRPIAPSGTTPVTVNNNNTTAVNSNNAQIITLTASMPAKPPMLAGNSTCSNLKPIQPKPVMTSSTSSTFSTTSHHDSVVNSSPMTTASNQSPSSSADRKSKKRRQRSSDSSSVSAKKSGDGCSTDNRVSLSGSSNKSVGDVTRVNGISSSRSADTVDKSGRSGGSSGSKHAIDPFDNPVSPAYSDISDANDSPAPVLEKEVDVKAPGVDRPGTGVDDVAVVGPPSAGFGATPCYFSQPPSLVPAVSRMDKHSSISPSGGVPPDTQPPTTEILSKEKQEETRQIMKENHDLKAHVSVTSGAVSLTKKDPPALTKVKEDSKVNSGIPLTSDSSKSKDVTNKKENTIKTSEISAAGRPRSSEGIRRNRTPTTSVPSGLFPNSRSDAFGIKTPPGQTFGPVIPDFLSPGATGPQHPMYFDQPLLRHFTPTSMPGGGLFSLSNGAPYDLYPPISSHPHSHPAASMPPPPGMHPGLVPPLISPHVPTSSQQHKIHELAEQAKRPDSPGRGGSGTIPNNHCTATNLTASSVNLAPTSRANNSSPSATVSAGGERSGKSPADVAAAAAAVAAMGLRPPGPLPGTPHHLIAAHHHLLPPHPFGLHPVGFQTPHGQIPSDPFLSNSYLLHGVPPQNLPLFQHK